MKNKQSIIHNFLNLLKIYEKKGEYISSDKEIQKVLTKYFEKKQDTINTDAYGVQDQLNELEEFIGSVLQYNRNKETIDKNECKNKNVHSFINSIDFTKKVNIIERIESESQYYYVLLKNMNNCIQNKSNFEKYKLNTHFSINITSQYRVLLKNDIFCYQWVDLSERMDVHFDDQENIMNLTLLNENSEQFSKIIQLYQKWLQDYIQRRDLSKL